MSWTEERIDKLKALWTQGMTASQIAEELGGVSRNAVIGKAHRLDLQSRPSPVKGADEGEKPVAKKVVAPAAAAPKVRLPAQTPMTSAPAPAMAPRPVSPGSSTVNPSIPLPQRPVSAAVGPAFRSIGPGGFVRQAPGEQAPPSTPAPPRRLVPAKPSADIAGKTGLLDLSEKICKWPMGHPGEPDFHFCGVNVNPGFPYCVAHCGLAYQAQMPRRDRRPPPPLPFGGVRVR
jgi:GcrA cell cycle regulator